VRYLPVAFAGAGVDVKSQALKGSIGHLTDGRTARFPEVRTAVRLTFIPADGRRSQRRTLPRFPAGCRRTLHHEVDKPAYKGRMVSDGSSPRKGNAAILGGACRLCVQVEDHLHVIGHETDRHDHNSLYAKRG
jgi:hypothetical protein